jgi:hypothetical protein
LPIENIFTGIRLDKWYIHSTSSDTFTSIGEIVITVIITITINEDLSFADNSIVNTADNIFPNIIKTKFISATCPIVKGCIDSGK